MRNSSGLCPEGIAYSGILHPGLVSGLEEVTRPRSRTGMLTLAKRLLALVQDRWKAGISNAPAKLSLTPVSRKVATTKTR